ncbi:hypothetical protein SO694_00003671 [Aureococcus anophagefferens]|uniref:DUF2834 domain-containing protein n=1 Tax=Aureococcus anophagefferens TaxID=44056 RepID=A0ABR1GDN0_AURAN
MPSLLAFALLLAPAAPFHAMRPAPAAPALGGRFAAQPPAQARSSVALRAAGTQDDDAFLAEGVRTPLRVFGIGALWLGLIGYIAIGAPGKSEAAQALDSELLAKLVANPFDPSCPALFTVLFNWMGVWPAVYAALLLPGADDQKPVPAVPFLAASVAFGMFAISPYLALREYRGATNRAPASLGGKWFESKLNAAVLGAGAVGLAAWGATAGDFGANVAEFKQLFDTQLFVHATTCDFCCLSLLAVGLVREDVERRGADEKLAALALVPLFGPLAWLLVRPSLNEA